MAIKKTSRKKFNWIGFAILMVVLIGLGLGLYFYFDSRKKNLSYSEFLQTYNKATKSTIDKHYFKKIVSDFRYVKLTITEVEDDVTKTYVVAIPTINEFNNFIKRIFGTVDAIAGKKVVGVDGTKVFEAPGISLVNKKDFFESIVYSQPSAFESWMRVLLPMSIIIGFIVWMSLRSLGGGGNNPFNVGSNKAIKMTSNKKFSDIAGNEEVKEEVMELVDYLKHPQNYQKAGARIPKGVLLAGAPGTGKTLIAKATAGEAGVLFYFISASNFVEMFVGVGAKRVREMFKDARKNSPCIIFIDELDAVGRSRGAGLGGGNDEREQTLNQLLVEMDGMEENVGLLVIAATNRPDVLDPALQRPGRFDRSITITLPDVKEREAILKIHARGKRIHQDIDFSKIAKRTPGFSGAQLENVVNEASLLSVRERTEVIQPHQIDEAIDRVIAGPAKKSRVISKEELTMISYHEAGHAVIGIKVKSGDKVQKVTLIPRGHVGGYNLMTPEKETYTFKKSQLYARIMSFMGGRAAEQIIYGEGEVSNGASDDIQKATSIARKMVTEWGMSDELGPIQYEKVGGGPFLGRDYMKNKDFSDQVGYEIDKAVRKIILECEEKAIKIIKANLKLLKLIASALLEKETLVAEDIEYIVKYGKIPKNKNKEIKKSNQKTLQQLIDEVKTNKKNVQTKSKSNDQKTSNLNTNKKSQ